MTTIFIVSMPILFDVKCDRLDAHRDHLGAHLAVRLSAYLWNVPLRPYRQRVLCVLMLQMVDYKFVEWLWIVSVPIVIIVCPSWRDFDLELIARVGLFVSIMYSIV